MIMSTSPAARYANRMASNQSDYPVQFSVDYPDQPLNRLTTLFRWILILPVYLLGLLVTAYTTVPLVFLLLFRGKYPRWWFDWNLELWRFNARIEVYSLALRDEYPATDDHQAVHLDVDFPDAATDLNRWLPLVKWVLAIPHYVVLTSPRNSGPDSRRSRLDHGHHHRPLPTRDLRFPGRRRPLRHPCSGLHHPPRHRPLPTLPPRPLSVQGRVLRPLRLQRPHNAAVLQRSDHGSFTSIPQPLNPSTSRVATAMPLRARAIAAIWQSNWLIGRPAARRWHAMSA